MKSNLFPNFKTNSINNKEKYVIKEIKVRFRKNENQDKETNTEKIITRDISRRGSISPKAGHFP
jgi:hypothetical protein